MTRPPIRRLLVANRGEIAVRVIRACRELGIRSVAVHSTIDARAPHVRAADLALEIGEAPAAQSYLSIEKILDAARRAGADAIHPGYGFLAENAAFAAACAEAGFVFVGPPPDVIARMGSKIAARGIMERAGVPIVPGETPRDQSDRGLRDAIARVGYPALIKASAGGGGRGMRIVRGPAERDESIAAARREAVAAFGDGTLYVERLLERPRHIEIQIFGDHAGTFVHLFERDCSVQRRHQKVIEESPSPVLTPRLRRGMGEAAVAAARAVGYRNAGTVEFLLEGAGDRARFYFLEMNTRLQVEHPVTEAVTGVDLVRAQIQVAAGERLPWTQDALSQRGHAIECRVYAEDPDTFLPQAGRIVLYREPAGPGLRIDAGIVEGGEVPVHYDPLLAKLIATAEDRAGAIARASAALRRYPVLGIRTNIDLLVRVLEHPRFRAGDMDTGFIETEGWSARPRGDAWEMGAALAAAAIDAGRPADARAAQRAPTDPWDTLVGWRS